MYIHLGSDHWTPQCCRIIIKTISRGSLAGYLVRLDAGSTTHLNLQIPEHASKKTLPSSRLVLYYVLEIDSPLVVLVAFWLLPYLINNPNHRPLLMIICIRCHTQDNPADIHRVHELNIDMREIHLVDVKYCEYTQLGH